MPTPESESFLRKKPTVPPTFDGVDLGNSEAVANARDAIIREQWVQVMMARLVREEMGKCYHREGVNHLEKCGKYRGTIMGQRRLIIVPLADPELQTHTSNSSNLPKFMVTRVTNKTTFRANLTRTTLRPTIRLRRRPRVQRVPTSDSATHWVPRAKDSRLHMLYRHGCMTGRLGGRMCTYHRCKIEAFFNSTFDSCVLSSHCQTRAAFLSAINCDDRIVQRDVQNVWNSMH